LPSATWAGALQDKKKDWHATWFGKTALLIPGRKKSKEVFVKKGTEGSTKTPNEREPCGHLGKGGRKQTP